MAARAITAKTSDQIIWVSVTHTVEYPRLSACRKYPISSMLAGAIESAISMVSSGV